MNLDPYAKHTSQTCSLDELTANRPTGISTNTQKRLGGAGRDRTDDLKLAKLALSQLSYGPEKALSVCTMRAQQVVGLDRLELSTSRLSGVRSNHLSYRPEGHMRSSKKDQTRSSAVC